MSPVVSFGKFAGGGKAGEFGAGAGAAGRAVVSGAGAENEVLGVGFDSGLGRGEALDVVDFAAVLARDVLGVQGVADGSGELRQRGDVFRFDFRTLVGNEKKPIPPP